MMQSQRIRNRLSVLRDKFFIEKNRPVATSSTTTTAAASGPGLHQHRLRGHEIRLVHLLPKSLTDATIKCNLVLENLDGVFSYEALSYEWGPPSPSLTILLDGKETPVRENLWWALHHLQGPTETRVIWIDALCINQEDTEERNAQVALMGKIYRSATCCIAWIGREKVVDESKFRVDDCGPGMNFIKNSQVRRREDGLKTLSQVSKEEHDSFESLCRRKYWTRLWITQEILLSPHVKIQCGPHTVQWQALSYVFDYMKAVVHASYHFAISTSAPFYLHQTSNVRKYETHDSTLPDLVIQFKSSQCEDQRDKVFGLLSLARMCCRMAVKADYDNASEQICATLLIHQLDFHDKRDTWQNLDTAADIQELCETVMLSSKPRYISRREDTSIASASMKAFRQINIPQDEPASAGTVVFSIPVMEVQEAFDTSLALMIHLEYFKAIKMKRPMSDLPNLPTKENIIGRRKIESKDILDIFLSRIDDKNAFYSRAKALTDDRPSLRKRLQSPREMGPARGFTHFFLTDMGLSGISEAGVKCDDVARKSDEESCYVNFYHQNDLHFSHPEIGICVDSGVPFQQLLSWYM